MTAIELLESTEALDPNSMAYKTLQVLRAVPEEYHQLVLLNVILQIDRTLGDMKSSKDGLH